MTFLWHHARSLRFSLGAGRGLRPRHIMAHGSSYLHPKIQLPKSYGLRDISKCHVFMSGLWLTDTQTDIHIYSEKYIYIDRYHIKSYMRIFCNLHIQYVTLHTHLCILRKKIFSNSSCLKRTGIFCNIRYYRLPQMPSFLNARNLKCLLVRNITGIWFFRNSVLANFLCWNRRSNGHWLYSVHWLFDYISNDRL